MALIAMESPSSLLVVEDLVIAKSFYVNDFVVDTIEEYEEGIKLKLGQHNVLFTKEQWSQLSISMDIMPVRHWFLPLNIWMTKSKS